MEKFKNRVLKKILFLIHRFVAIAIILLVSGCTEYMYSMQETAEEISEAEPDGDSYDFTFFKQYF